MGINEAAADKTDADSQGLLFGCVLNGEGGCLPLNWDAAKNWSPVNKTDVLWLHLDRTVDGVDAWLNAKLNVSETTAEALTSNDCRSAHFKRNLSARL